MTARRSPEGILAVFGSRLAALRTGRGMTQTDLADRAGIVRSSVANMEAGRQNPGLRQLAALADILDVNIAVLIGDEEHELISDTEERIQEWKRRVAEARRAAEAASAARRLIPPQVRPGTRWQPANREGS